MSAPSRPVLRYHGGKWRLAPWIVGHFPYHRVYVEAFGGGGSVLMRKSRTYAEVYNDRWGDICNVFRVLRDKEQAAELERRFRLTPFARDEFAAIDEASFAAVADPIERARLLIFRSFAGFGSNAHCLSRKTGFRATSNRSGTTPAHDWANYPNTVAAFTARLQGVVIENRVASEVMTQHDAPETLHYVDPPYVHSTRAMNNPYDLAYGGYEFEMSDEEHRQLAEDLHKLQGMVILSGYRSALYDECFSDWQRIETATHADGARDRTECLWLNAASVAALGHGPLFACSGPLVPVVTDKSLEAAE
jgi:DNA adenine methylase